MKKSISPLIGWVLLIGFTVALGVVVSNWAIKQAQQLNPAEMAEGGIYCGDVAFSAENICWQAATDPFRYVTLKLKNRGAFSIFSLAIDVEDGGGVRSLTKDEFDPSNLPLDPGDIKDVKLVINDITKLKKIVLTPVINIEGKDMICNEKKVLLTDSDMLQGISAPEKQCTL